MNMQGQWKLSPAYDVIYAHNPAGQWTHQHQMSINAKRGNFSRSDLLDAGEAISIPKPQRILNQVIDVVKQWPRFAGKAGVERSYADEIARHHRLGLSG